MWLLINPAKMVFVHLLLLSFGISTMAQNTEVEFPSGVTLAPVKESSLLTKDKDATLDKKSIGSYLFYLSDDLKDVYLASTIQAGDIMSPKTNYFRAHPLFLQCVDKIRMFAYSKLQLQVSIKQGFIPATSSASAQDEYATSGAAAILSSSDPLTVIDTAFTFCPLMFAPYRCVLSAVVLNSTMVHLHMSAVGDYTSDCSPSIYQDRCTNSINKALDPVVVLSCASYQTVTSGSSSPSGLAEDVVGSADSNVTIPSDYLDQLVYYPGSTIMFQPTDRLMSTKMFYVLKSLQKYVMAQFPSASLKVNTLFKSDGASLNLEGRIASLQLNRSTTLAELQTLSTLALCTGADYVKNTGIEVIVAVKKQSTIDPSYVEFPKALLVEVTPPQSHMTNLQVPALHINSGETLPIFDMKSVESTATLGQYSTLTQFASPYSRYIRVHPAIAQCYDALVLHEMKWNANVPVPINIVTAFQTLSDATYNCIDDPRCYSYLKGQGFKVIYGQPFTPGSFAAGLGIKFDITRLAKAAVYECGKIFHQKGYGLGLGFYEDGLHIDMRAEDESDLKVWIDDGVHLPHDLDFNEAYTLLENRYIQTIIGRVINPADPETACGRQVLPQPPSPDYNYKDSLGSKRRRKRQATSETECEPTRDTDFCVRTDPHREAQVRRVWAILERKHSYRSLDDLWQALYGCLGDCGTCVIGEIYQDKTEHCSNFIHWAPFTLKNDEPDITNLHPIDDLDLDKVACQGSRHCLTETPLYAILASSVKFLYRPDPKGSVEEELYGQSTNPLPVYELLYEMYAINARGNLTVWVHNEKDIGKLAKPLKTAMVYNKNVTSVMVVVSDWLSQDSIRNSLESLIADWTSGSCAHNTRDYVVPYTVVQPPTAIRKRDVSKVNYEEFSFREKLLLDRHNYEKIWQQKLIA